MMPKFELPRERVAAAGRTDITTTDSAREALPGTCAYVSYDGRACMGFPRHAGGDSPLDSWHVLSEPEALHVDPQEALRREVEIGKLATRLRIAVGLIFTTPVVSNYERGARAGPTAYRECYELCVLIAGLSAYDLDMGDIAKLITAAEGALEATR